MILPPTGALVPEMTGGGLLDVGERCGFFLLTGDLLVCFEKILPWFASLFGQPDRLRKQNRILPTAYKTEQVYSEWLKIKKELSGDLERVT